MKGLPNVKRICSMCKQQIEFGEPFKGIETVTTEGDVVVITTHEKCTWVYQGASIIYPTVTITPLNTTPGSSAPVTPIRPIPATTYAPSTTWTTPNNNVGQKTANRKKWYIPFASNKTGDDYYDKPETK